MKKESSEKVKPETKKVRFNLYAPGTERVSLAGDSNACLLVIPEVFRMQEHLTPCQERLPEYHL